MSEDILDKYYKYKARKETSERNLKRLEAKTFRDKKKISRYRKAIALTTKFIEYKRGVFKEQLEELLTLAIKGVFDRDYRFVLDFKMKGDQLESCKPFYYKGDRPFEAKGELGDGIDDVTTMLARPVFWKLAANRKRNLLLYDEPLGHVGKGTKLARAGRALRDISKKLPLQILYISHEKQLEKIADKVFFIAYDGKKASVARVIERNKKIRRRKK